MKLLSYFRTVLLRTNILPRSTIRTYDRLDDANSGFPFPVQFAMQQYICDHRHGLKLGLADLEAVKARYIALYKADDFAKFYYYALTFADVLPVDTRV